MDIFWDPIISIRRVPLKECSSSDKVYDLTVANTRNFNTSDGLAMRDTFHLAGVGSPSASGIKRLTELYNHSKPSTPTMKLFFHPNVDGNTTYPLSSFQVRQLSQKLPCCMLEDIIETFEIKYDDGKIQENEQWMRNWHQIYAKTPLGVRYDTERSLSKYYVQLSLNRKKLLQLELRIGDIQKRIQDNFQVYVCASPHLNDILTLKIYMPLDMASPTSTTPPTKEKEKEKEKNKFSMKENDETLASDKTTMETWEFWNIYAKEMFSKLKIMGLSDVKSVTVESLPFTKEWYVRTEGINLKDINEIPEIDQKRTLVDQVQVTLEHFGIEAARYVLFDQITQVLQEAGSVDPRHIMLLVDNMTFSGIVNGATRFSMKRNAQMGFIEKSCFESSDSFLLNAATSGETDPLNGVSAKIAFGQQMKMGTGCFDILLHPEILENAQKECEEEEYFSAY